MSHKIAPIPNDWSGTKVTAKAMRTSEAMTAEGKTLTPELGDAVSTRHFADHVLAELKP